MESTLSMLSSLKENFSHEDYILPHYKEAYRLAIDSLVSTGKQVYQEFLQAEKLVSFLSEDEIDFITQNAEQLPVNEDIEDVDSPTDEGNSTGTYWPTHSDAPPPDLDLGWPEVMHSKLQTNINILYNPPRANGPTIKESLRKHIQDARQVIAIAMDAFTDVDVFKEVVDASIRGIPVYILLDHGHFKSFLTMLANLDIQIQKLRNMRVRTVQGQEYVCKSGAKFHGGMGHKFVLIDCQTVFFGTYSLIWSCEKIHLNMVQVITGDLVESYDEEFRTLYARSNVPVELQPQDISSDRSVNGKLENYLGRPIRAFERKDHLRHTLDSVYRQTCERQAGFRGMGEDLLIPHHSRFLQDAVEFNKRHSYAGEPREPSHIIPQSRYGSSNWNVAEDVRRFGGNYPNIMESGYGNARMNFLNRTANLRQSYHGHDKQVLSMQQNLPSLSSTSKSFLRTWRIESYLKNSDAPIGEPCDYLDQYEMENKPVPAMHSRLRSSLVFRSIIPEDSEPNSYTNDSMSSLRREDQFGMQPGAQYYASTQWNQADLRDNRVQPDEFMFKRMSMQVPEHSGKNLGFSSGREILYASLGRAKSRYQVKEPELQDNLYKRHSVADPRHSTYNNNNTEPSSHLFGHQSRNHIEKGSVTENSVSRGFPQNFSEDQRSVSHYNVKTAESNNVQSAIWQEPPSRTVSATGLEVEDINQNKSSMIASPRFFKKGTQKIKSLLNIPEKRDSSPKRKNNSSTKTSGSSDTLLSDDNELKARQDKKHQSSVTASMKSSDSGMLKKTNGRISGTQHPAPALAGESSAPRFSTEELHRDGSVTAPDRLYANSQESKRSLVQDTTTTTGQWQREPVRVNRVYSRFEPLCSFETKHSSSGQGTGVSVNKADRHRISLLSRGNTSTDQSNHIGQHGHENKLGRFIQRVGNLINKNK